jgi:hypothetical protein
LEQDFEVGVGGEGFPEEEVAAEAPSSGEVRVLLLVLLVLLLKFLLLA